MPIFEIKNRFSGAVIFSLECGSLRLCVEAAVKARVDLSGANLCRADLSGADLSGADLFGADLSRADLFGADLSGAHLSGANLCRADLSGADLSGASYGDGIPIENVPLQLQGTKYNIIVMDTHIKIGCKLYSHNEWENFSDAEILEMDTGALEWWEEWKGVVLSLSLGHQQRIKSK